MARNPRSIRPNQGYGGAGRVLGDEPPAEVYGLKHGRRAVPDRSREPRIGPACYDTDKTVPGVASTEELRSGVDFGSTRGIDTVAKTRQEYGDAARESRGVRIRPVRPGQHA
jgi:hypothetical protein